MSYLNIMNIIFVLTFIFLIFVSYYSVSIKYSKQQNYIKKVNGLCNNPIAHVKGNMTIPEEFLGKCVRVYVPYWYKTEQYFDVIVGSKLLDEGKCSEIAKKFNDPVKEWDFSGTGYCGLGKPGGETDGVTPLKYLTGMRLGCLSHDVCVWVNCKDNRLKPAYGHALANGYKLKNQIQYLPTGGPKEIRAYFHDKSTRNNVLRLGEPICGRALSETESVFGIGFENTWCPPGLKLSNPYLSIIGGNCIDKKGNHLFIQGVGTYEQMQREKRFWKMNPQLITWLTKEEKKNINKL